MLGWVLFDKRKEQEDIIRYKQKYSSETADYLKEYDQWLQLPPEERTQLPMVLDKDGKTKTKSQLQQEQQERLKADMDRLASGEMDNYPFAEDFYGKNWREEVNRYKKQQELNEFIFTGSIVCTSMGGAILSWFVLLEVARLLIKIFSVLERFLAGFSKHSESKKEQDEEHSDIISSEENTPLEDEHKSETNKQESDESVESKLPSMSKLNEHPQKKSEKIQLEKGKDNDKSKNREEIKPPQKKVIPLKRKKIAVMPSNKEHVELEASAIIQTKSTNLIENQAPIDNTLEELTEQVSAIREYTAFQQNRLEKLQDGYDWNIIRTFCLRIIRCIDNLDTRISQMSEQDSETTHLKEARDELIFALESSGVEQFEPEINSEYRGQEKYAEVIKSKQRCTDPKMAGKIANVVRPGYHYLINDENVKVIRPAQVRLFAR